jgi:hypothetical protein
MKVDGKYVAPLNSVDGVEILTEREPKYQYEYKGKAWFTWHCGVRMMKFRRWAMTTTILRPEGVRDYLTSSVPRICPLCGRLDYDDDGFGGYE